LAASAGSEAELAAAVTGMPSGTALAGEVSCTEAAAGSPLESDWLIAAVVCAGGGGAVKRPSVVESLDAASASEFELIDDFVEEFVDFWLEDVLASAVVAGKAALVLPGNVELALPDPWFFPADVWDDDDVCDATATDWSPEPDTAAAFAPVAVEDFPDVEPDELELLPEGGSGPSVVAVLSGSLVVEWPGLEPVPEVDPPEVDFWLVVVPLESCVVVLPDVFVPVVVPECGPVAPVVGIVVFSVDPEVDPESLVVLLTGGTGMGVECGPCVAGGVDEVPFVPGAVGCSPNDCPEVPSPVCSGVTGSMGSVSWPWPGTIIRIGGTGVGTSALPSPSDSS